MDSKTFFAEVAGGQWKRVYLLEGEEEYAKDRGVDALMAGVPEALREFNADLLDDPGVDSLMELARTLPMMGERRLIVVKNARMLGKADGDAKAFAAFLPEIPESSTVALLQRGKADKRKALYKAIAKMGGTVDFAPYSEGEAARWAVQYAKRKDVTLPPAQAAQLVEMVGSGTGEIAAELDKLCDFADRGGSVTQGMLEQSVRPRLEYSVFTMLEHFLAGRQGKAFAQLEQAFREEGSDAVFQLTAFFSSRLRAMLAARRLLGQGKREGEIVAALGGSPYAAKKSIQAAKGFTEEALEDALLLMAEVDYDGKTGRRPPAEALETALGRIFGVKK